MKYVIGILLTVASLVLPGALLAQGVLENPQPEQWQESMQDFVITDTAGSVQPIAAIDGLWDFTGELSQKSCAEPSSLTTVSDIFQIDGRGKALYATASIGTLEFFGEMQGHDFTISTSPRSAALNESCTQVVALIVEGNFRDQRASYTIVNDFIGSCPGASDCEFVFEGPFIPTTAKRKGPIKNIKSPSSLFEAFPTLSWH